MKLKKMASFFLAITTVFCASASVMAADFSPNSNTESLRAAKVAAAAEIAYLDVKTAAPALKAEILEITEGGNRLVKFYYNGIFNEILSELGETPLPPYIHEKLADRNRYQTVYAKHDGSAAAPTAGLHFNEEMLEAVKAKGIKLAFVTLHVGLGTFRPVKADKVTDHLMHSEYYHVTNETAEIINSTKRSGGKVICVGTTSTRVVESIADENGFLAPASGYTNIFIYPGYRFKCLDGLITNFHLPKSTLIMLVSALAGKEHVLAAYREAVQEQYRFFSFGDAMLIL